jgi:hypothetical protein
MSKYQTFIFKDYRIDSSSKTLSLDYSFDDQLNFTETYRFDFEWCVPGDNPVLDRAIQNLFFMAGVSYYKTYVAPEIVIRAGELDEISAEFFSKTYQRGLGEFFYTNQLSPDTKIEFPANSDTIVSMLTNEGEGTLVGIGGGKDSLVTVELLRGLPGITTWSAGHKSQLEPLIQAVGLPHLWVDRVWDSQLLEVNKQDAYNGHIPISAVLACVGTIAAILGGKRDVVVSNEQSANEPTLNYQGVAINHQYSKSQEFERDYQQLLQRQFGGSLRYYSFLRPLSELRIAELFAGFGFEKYKHVFSSCNRAFVHDSTNISWCGECSKCAFVFLILTPFVKRIELESMWGGKNLLLDPALEPTYKQLLGIEGDKPMECVGEIKESRAAMRLAQKQYPQLAEKYNYDLPEDYDYRALAGHEMPAELFSILKNALDK